MCVVFCDISKAFDRVWHKGLIFKLKQPRVRGSLLNWISNYLGYREHRVIVGQSYSDVKHVKAGVPQGSVLGRLLFLVYVYANDITHNLLSITRLFADDTSLDSTTSNSDDLQGNINHDQREISKWSKQWLVTFNPDKIEVLYFVNYQPPMLEFNNIVLATTFDEVTLNDDCKWNPHINNICFSSSKSLGIMRKLKFTVKRNTLNQIYISFLRPILEYSSVVWDNCSKYEKDRLERMQLEAVRIVTDAIRSINTITLYDEIG